MCYCPKLHILTAKERQRILILLTDFKKKITSEHSSVPYHLTFTQTLWQKAFQPKLPHYIWPERKSIHAAFLCVCVHKLSGPARSMPTLKKGQQQKHTHTHTHTQKNPSQMTDGLNWPFVSTLKVICVMYYSIAYLPSGQTDHILSCTWPFKLACLCNEEHGQGQGKAKSITPAAGWYLVLGF